MSTAKPGRFEHIFQVRGQSLTSDFACPQRIARNPSV
jgi:hypothetical protein